MTHDRLTDYQIAEAFGDTLSLIYKKKMEELNNDLAPVYAHLDRLQIPQVPEFHRWFARATVPHWTEERFKAIDHIQKIRNIYKKMKKEPEGEQFNIEKARNVPIDSIYNFIKKGKNVSCPFHEDKHPSASIKYNRLVCFQCGYKGDTIALFQKLNNVSFKDAIKTLSN